MKVLIASDFYTDFELWQTDSFDKVKNYAINMLKGLDAEEPGKLIGSQFDWDAESAIKNANFTIFLSKLEEEIEEEEE